MSKKVAGTLQLDDVCKFHTNHSQSCGSAPQTTAIKNSALVALTSAALVLPGLLLSTAEAANASLDSFSFQYSRYQEGKRNLFTVPNKVKPIQADVINASGYLSLTDRVKFSYHYSRDTWGGATPVTSAPLATNGNRPILKSTSSGLVAVGASPSINTEILLDRQLNPIRRDFVTGDVIGKDTRTVEILSSASPETRNAADFTLGYEWNEAALTVGGGFSSERDFKSSYGNVSGRLDFNQKLTSLKFGFGYTSSEISAILDQNILPYLTRSAFANQIESRGGSEILHGNRHDWTSNLGLTQILDKNSLIDFNIGYTHGSGFMENPYKAMTVIFVDPEFLNDNQNTPIIGDVRALLEQRPDIRNQVAISSKYIQYISPLEASLHLNYKFSFDDWGINTHTLTTDWVQPLNNGWTITPRIRYYSQDAANFYQPYLFSQQVFNQNNTVQYDANKLPNNFASDYRLSGYGSLSSAITLNKKFAKGIELQAGFEYYMRESSLKLGGDGGSSFADFDFYVASAAIKINIEKLNFNGSGGNGGESDHSEQSVQQRHHYGGHVPAGVMFGHMLDKAEDFLVSYRFIYSHQAGDMLNGTRAATDQAIVDLGCSDAIKCRYTPTHMNIYTHMFNIMYAPTNWLNLILMPKFVDMDMNTRELSGRPAPEPGVNEHSGIAGHSTGGVGDTTLSSLVKLVDVPGHRLHMGLGLSAPTGDVDLQFRRVFRIDGGFAHFGLQLGSGTWDFLPSLTYTGEHNRWDWGAQLNGIKRMENQNESGYRLGDLFQATTWSGYRLTEWLSASVRGIYTVQSAIHGDFNGFNGRAGPMDFPANNGGQFWDVGIGVNANIPRGKYAGNNFAFEWLQPIQDDVNGYQLERKGALAAIWSYSF